MTAEAGPVPFGPRLTQLAEERPDDVAAVFVPIAGDERLLTFADLETLANRQARFLAEGGVGAGDRVVVGLPKSVEQLALGFAVWKVGATLVPLRADLPVPERDPLIALADPALVVADWAGVDAVSSAELRALDGDASPLPDAAVPVPLLIASGGSTGRSKLIATPLPGTVTPGQPFNPVGALIGMRAGQTAYTGSPPYHFMGFGNFVVILEGGRSVVLERFEPTQLLDAVERHRINLLALVPTMMLRLLRSGLTGRDLSSVEAIVHSAAPCPAWVKQGWIDAIGADRVYEIYGATEQVGFTVVSGAEWLERPGTVGKGVLTEIRVLDEAGVEVATGEVGEIHMRLGGLPEPVYEYIGAERGPVTGDGFASVGDLGSVDADGYLYIADRRTDLIISGGANVFPAEVEAVLSEHPSVADAGVIGVPDDEWGRRVHAVVAWMGDDVPEFAALDAHCRARLAAYKVPRSYEFVDALPRNEAGKLRRSALLGDADAPRRGAAENGG